MASELVFPREYAAAVVEAEESGAGMGAVFLNSKLTCSITIH
jgi:hypothetical protein